jgi:hypothetical protein
MVLDSDDLSIYPLIPFAVSLSDSSDMYFQITVFGAESFNLVVMPLMIF